jgi:hypothetical protein
MSKIEANTIDSISGTSTLTLGSTNASTVALGSGDVQSNFLRPDFMIRQASATSLTNATRTKVSLDTAVFDVDSGLDATNKRWVVPSNKGGKYYITYSLRYESGSDFENCNVLVYKNGSALYSVWGRNEFYNTFTGSFIADLDAGDYLEMYGLQSSGGAINASTSDYGLQTYLGGCRIGT